MTADAQISRQNISYYDAIAPEYDAMLLEHESNAAIRRKVAGTFSAIVKSGTVMDFGGGTGQDLGWLTKHGFNVLFCEPSAGMRQIAIERSKSEFPGVVFLADDQTEFRLWHADSFPQKSDAILANFAVINCIPDIDLLFEKLAYVLKPGGHLIALVLDTRYRQKLRSKLKAAVQSLFRGNTLSTTIEHKGKSQQVYLHSTTALKKACAQRFEFRHGGQLYNSGFRLIHLVCK